MVSDECNRHERAGAASPDRFHFEDHGEARDRWQKVVKEVVKEAVGTAITVHGKQRK